MAPGKLLLIKSGDLPLPGLPGPRYRAFPLSAIDVRKPVNGLFMVMFFNSSAVDFDIPGMPVPTARTAQSPSRLKDRHPLPNVLLPQGVLKFSSMPEGWVELGPFPGWLWK